MVNLIFKCLVLFISDDEQQQQARQRLYWPWQVGLILSIAAAREARRWLSFLLSDIPVRDDPLSDANILQ
jgi:hypothetical protein